LTSSKSREESMEDIAVCAERQLDKRGAVRFLDDALKEKDDSTLFKIASDIVRKGEGRWQELDAVRGEMTREQQMMLILKHFFAPAYEVYGYKPANKRVYHYVSSLRSRRAHPATASMMAVSA